MIIRIPVPLRRYTRGAPEVVAEGETVAECLANLRAYYPGIGPRILDENNNPRPSFGLLLGPFDVRSLQGLRTPVHDGDVLSIVQTRTEAEHKLGRRE